MRKLYYNGSSTGRTECNLCRKKRLNIQILKKKMMEEIIAFILGLVTGIIVEYLHMRKSILKKLTEGKTETS